MNVNAMRSENLLLRCIPEKEWETLKSSISEVDLELGQVLSEPGRKTHWIYFPANALVSILYNLENGGSAEIAIIGNEGMTGISIFLGGESTTSRAVVQSAGRAYKIRSEIVLDLFNNSPPVMHLFLRFTQAKITQMSQTAVCNRHHSIDQQLCRWLLLSIDRLSGNELVMTQDLIANMLGVRREGVTEVAGKLQREGFITYSRGHITVLDRAALEKRTCECYAVVKREYDRLLPDKIAV